MNTYALTPEDKAAPATTRPAAKTVLLLEDEGDAADTLKGYLELNGFKVKCVANGVDGLKEIMAADYSVIVCDMMMPNLPGDMFYLAVERTKPHLCKRFIFMTGYKGNKKIEDFIRKIEGIMLWKPFEASELLDTVQMVVRTADA